VSLIDYYYIKRISILNATCACKNFDFADPLNISVPFKANCNNESYKIAESILETDNPSGTNSGKHF